MADETSKYVTPLTSFVAFIVCLLFISLGNWVWIAHHPLCAFLVTLLSLMGGLTFIGLGVNGRWDGVLIDNRNRVSLSKFQTVAWTVLVLATLVTVAAHNLGTPDGDPLVFGIPAELLSAMGISAASFVATPLVLSLKADEQPAPEDMDAALAKMGMPAEEMKNDGKVFGRKSAALASWADMFRGEEVGNAASPDLSKIQQLFISLLLYGVYGVAVVHSLSTTPGKIGDLPALNPNFIWLLGLSHASYLAYKAAPHTKDAPDPPPAPANAQ